MSTASSCRTRVGVARVVRASAPVARRMGAGLARPRPSPARGLGWWWSAPAAVDPGEGEALTQLLPQGLDGRGGEAEAGGQVVLETTEALLHLGERGREVAFLHAEDGHQQFRIAATGRELVEPGLHHR